MTKINQPELVVAILMEIARQHPGITVEGQQYGEIVKAANLVCAVFEGKAIEQVVPWVSVQDRMPIVDDGNYSPQCLVYVSCGSLSCAGYDYWITDINQWAVHENDEVTHWYYINDIPAPVTEGSHDQ
ncbi:hypothetical protein [Xenorhabdus littoralis]|uniref:hypothetical protein n=1 Tax=Xenorhabdus littoralis TaxID=2582835 RepID=UPI0029E82949|nr:hypothetical protein [Xenorhabdus sp. psl]MDX7993000.1 hypothetical protein [Xenorhabdus sp. psl]